jgi:hypothetical protein
MQFVPPEADEVVDVLSSGSKADGPTAGNYTYTTAYVDVNWGPAPEGPPKDGKAVPIAMGMKAAKDLFEKGKGAPALPTLANLPKVKNTEASSDAAKGVKYVADANERRKKYFVKVGALMTRRDMTFDTEEIKKHFGAKRKSATAEGEEAARPVRRRADGHQLA